MRPWNGFLTETADQSTGGAGKPCAALDFPGALFYNQGGLPLMRQKRAKEAARLDASQQRPKLLALGRGDYGAFVGLFALLQRHLLCRQRRPVHPARHDGLSAGRHA